jgi:broad specificity phosphatase PhoE
MLYLVRHGRPLVDRSRPAHEWTLDPEAYDEVWALRESGRLPERAAWFSSPEPKALATAELLTDGDVGVVEGLREQVRDGTEWIEDFDDVVRRAFAVPDAVAVPGWEPLAACRERVVRAVDGILAAYATDDVVLVGHGTAWTALAAALTGTQPDLDKWHALQMPDLITVEDLRSK